MLGIEEHSLTAETHEAWNAIGIARRSDCPGRRLAPQYLPPFWRQGRAVYRSDHRPL
jgi:hypothetical protein